MNKRKICITFLLVFCLSMILAGCSGDEGKSTDGVIELKFSSMAFEEDMTYDICKAIADEINEKSDTVNVTFYPADQLGSWEVVFNEVMDGTIAMAHSAMAESYDPVVGSAFIPYICTDYNDMETFFGEGTWLMDAVSDACKTIDIYYGGTICDGLAGMATTKPLAEPTNPNVDKGIVIRVSSNSANQLAATSLGFRWSVLNFSDTFTAMQSGIVDGEISAPPGGTYLSFADVMKYYYDYRCYAEVTGLIVSQKVLDSLSEADQTIIKDALRRGSQESFVRSKEFNEDYVKIMEDEGIEVITFTQEELNLFRDNCMEKYWPELDKRFGTDFMKDLKMFINENI